MTTGTRKHSDPETQVLLAAIQAFLTEYFRVRGAIFLGYEGGRLRFELDGLLEEYAELTVYVRHFKRAKQLIKLSGNLTFAAGRLMAEIEREFSNSDKLVHTVIPPKIPDSWGNEVTDE